MRLLILTPALAVVAALSVRMFAQDVVLPPGMVPSAPDPSKPMILVQGVVLDKDTREPIAGAQVSGGAKTGPGGDFQLRTNPIQRLSVFAQADHYQAGSATVQITADQAPVYVEVLLAHLQSLRGALVDDETRKPIAGLQVELVLMPGAAMDVMGRMTRAVSAEDGSFLFPELPRGEYFLRISDKPAIAIEEIPAKDLEGDGRDKALEPPEGAASYGTIVWPGRNADMPSTPGITLGSSAVDVGEIRLSRNKLTNLTGLAAPCEEGASLQVMVSRPSVAAALGLLTTRDLTCGDGFRLLNLPDGTMNLTALQGFPQRRWVSQSIDSRSRSPVRLTLNAFVTVEISVEVEDGRLEDLPPNLRVALSSSNTAIKVDNPAMLRPGAFEATLYPGEQYFLSVQAGPQYYLKRATYNASELTDLSSFTASTAGVSQLNLVLSNHAASVEVHVTHNGKPPAARPAIFLLKDGMSVEGFRRQLPRMPLVSGDGLVFTGLAPGTYRVAGASPEGVLPTTEALFDAMLKDPSRQSMPVTVDEGQTATINWDIP